MEQIFQINPEILRTLPGLPAVWILCEVAKKYINDRWIPIVSLLIGVLYALGALQAPVFERVVVGIIVGGAASGFYRMKRVAVNGE